MSALVLTPDGPRHEDRSPAPRPGEAVVRPRLGGVCATDLELVRGYMGFEGVLGHEWVGVVESSPLPDQIGRRVVGDINCACGRCPTCLAGRPTHCPHRTVVGIVGRDGAFADRLSIPANNLHFVPDEVPDEAAVFVEPLAAALEILEQVHVRPSDRIAVLGTGRLGQLCARVLALTGARVVGVGRRDAPLGRLPAGIERARVDDLGDERFDVVVDCTGSAEGLVEATRRVRPRGTLVLKTTVHEQRTPPATPWVLDEITLVGSRCGPFAPALRLLASGAVDPRPLIDLRLPLADGVEALARAATPDVLKVVLEISR